MLKKTLLCFFLALAISAPCSGQPPAVAPVEPPVFAPIPPFQSMPQRAILTHNVDVIEVTEVWQPAYEWLPWFSFDGGRLLVYAPRFHGQYVTFWRLGPEEELINDGSFSIDPENKKQNSSRVFTMPHIEGDHAEATVWIRNYMGQRHVVIVRAPVLIITRRPTHPWVGLRPMQRWRLPEP